jgi:hypothetical protein
MLSGVEIPLLFGRGFTPIWIAFTIPNVSHRDLFPPYKKGEFLAGFPSAHLAMSSSSVIRLDLEKNDNESPST